MPVLSSSRVGLLLGMLALAGCGSATDSTTEPGSAGANTAAAGAGTAGAAQVANGGAMSGMAGAPSGTAGASGAGQGGTSGASVGGSGGSATIGGGGGSAGAARGGAAGMSGSAGSAGSGGMASDTDYLKTHASGYGFVNLSASSKNQILSLDTTLTVPQKPKANTGTLFLWPGLQPGGANYEPIDNGVLQPVLTWGPTCAPNAPNKSYASWWISGQYVNTYGMAAGYTDCNGGDGMNVAVGAALQLSMTLNGTVWHQTVTDAASNQSVSYDLDMMGQAQNYAEFVIEQYTQDPAGDVIFTATTIAFDKAEPAACQPTRRGMTDFFTNPKASNDGKQCSIDRIVLRAEGVAATSPN